MQPSVGHPNGLTTIPEYWDLHQSQNHMILLQIDEWFTAGLAGIKQTEGSVAYEQIVIRPHVVGDLRHVNGVHHSARGTVTSEWNRSADGKSITLDVTIPGTTEAEIHVPTVRHTTVKLDGRPARTLREVEFLGFEDGYAEFAVGPGEYQFTARL